MEDYRKHSLKQISTLFDSQMFAVLSTQSQDQPYANIIAFAADNNLEHIYFLTPDTTRKYDNLVANPKVAILVNNSLNQADDIYKAVSVTGIGTASVVEPSEKTHLLDMYLKKLSHLEKFSKAPTTAFIRVKMKRYFMVNQFQNVVEIQIKS